jgi:RNA polymerase sigma-70 factor (ECF subfamily)
MRVSVIDKDSATPVAFPELRQKSKPVCLTVTDTAKNTGAPCSQEGTNVPPSEDALATLTHEELALRIAQFQDRTAFKKLFFYFGPRVKAHLMKFGLDEERAEDLTQEVMVKVWQKATQFDPKKAKLSTWIFRIARNKFIDFTRKQKYPEVDVDDHLAEMVAPEQTDRPVEAMQTSKIVAAGIEKLNPDQQRVIRLSFFEEMSHSEIAAHLALPLGTVKSRIRIAFQTLRKELGESA